MTRIEESGALARKIWDRASVGTVFIENSTGKVIVKTSYTTVLDVFVTDMHRASEATTFDAFEQFVIGASPGRMGELLDGGDLQIAWTGRPKA